MSNSARMALMAPATTTNRPSEPACSIERCLNVLADQWSFLIIREALMAGVERFADFQLRLGIAPNVLSNRLERLVEAGVMTKRSYQEPGSRSRRSYHLTPSGRDLAIPLAALQQWGDEYAPRRVGPSVVRRTPTGSPVRVGFLDNADKPVAVEDCAFVEASPK
jgi:DNA-binding HxlR family transcriptional regulator